MQVFVVYSSSVVSLQWRIFTVWYQQATFTEVRHFSTLYTTGYMFVFLYIQKMEKKAAQAPEQAPARHPGPVQPLLVAQTRPRPASTPGPPAARTTASHGVGAPPTEPNTAPIFYFILKVYLLFIIYTDCFVCSFKEYLMFK